MALGYIDDDDLQMILGKLKAMLEKDGKMVFLENMKPGPEETGSLAFPEIGI